MLEELSGILQQWHLQGGGDLSATCPQTWLHLQETFARDKREESQLQCFVLLNSHLQTRYWQNPHFYRTKLRLGEGEITNLREQVWKPGIRRPRVYPLGKEDPWTQSLQGGA